MIKGSVNSIESFGLVDGPGIRCVVFLNGCKLRCKFCHNPEMWIKQDLNYTPEELIEKIKRFKPYFKNNGGVTFSGGEPLMQSEFLIQTCKLLKEENINIALDTAGVGVGKYEEILKYIDLIILDIKHIDPAKYRELTGHDIKESLEFINIANKMNKVFWIRQVVVPGLTDSIKYLEGLKKIIESIKNVEKVELLPYHKLGSEKYEKLGISNPYKNKKEMDEIQCSKLYEKIFGEQYK